METLLSSPFGPDDIRVARDRVRALCAERGETERACRAVSDAFEVLANQVMELQAPVLEVQSDSATWSIEARFDGGVALSDELLEAAVVFDRITSGSGRVVLTLDDHGDRPRREAAARAQLQNRETAARYRVAMAIAGVGAWTLADGEVRLSARAENLFGVRSPLSVEALAATFQQPDALLAALAGLDHQLAFQLELEQTNGSWLRISGTQHEAMGIGAVVDVSDRRQREIELADRLTFEKELVGVVSHDLKTPLSAITMGLGMLKVSEDQQPVMERLLRSTRRARGLVVDLLDFTRARLGAGIPVAPRPTDVHHLAEHALQALRTAHPEAVLALEPMGDATARVDPMRMTQVINNLVANAVQHGDPHRPITVSCGHSSGFVLRVHNHGPVIEEPMHQAIFRPLTRRTTHGRASLGLGLYIVQAIVRAHGGVVTLRSDAEAGTTFEVRVPSALPA